MPVNVTGVKQLIAAMDAVDKNLNKLFPKEMDAKTADAIMELFRKCESLDIFNKKALYIYIREMVDVETPQITKITKKSETLTSPNDKKGFYNLKCFFEGILKFLVLALLFLKL